MNTETKSGDCETCGAYSSERVDGMCAPCRKKYIADEKALRDGLITKSDYLKIWVDGVENKKGLFSGPKSGVNENDS